MPEGKPEFDVFLSYKSEDHAWVRELKDALQARGLKVWLDRDEILPGDRFAEALERGIESSGAVAIIVSPEAVRSEWVKEEYYRALGLANTAGRKLRLIPVLLREAELPGLLADRQWVDFRDGAVYEECVGRLCAGIAGRKPEALPLADPPLVSLAKLPVTSPDLFGREQELAILNEAWEDPHTHLVTIVAFGGIGKSALTNSWLASMAQQNYRGARRVFGWSFYSQGTKENYGSSDQFIDAALQFFGDADPTQGTSWEKGVRLAQLIRGQRAFLVLDGVEPLQWGPGPQEGKLRDRNSGMAALLRELSHGMDGLCVVTSRVRLTDLPDSPEPGVAVRRIDLDHLSREAGRALLRCADVEGPDEELERATEEYEGHALALVLLGEYLRDFLGADITRRSEVPLVHDRTRAGGHASNVMEAYDAALKRDDRRAERVILRLVGLFDRPASRDCLDALRNPAIPRVTSAIRGLRDEEWKDAIHRLRRWRLLSAAPDPDDGSLDAHPLVREFVGQKLEGESQKGSREAHGRLFDHLCKTATEYPDTLEEMQPLFQAVHHGCRAGRYQETLKEVYYRRIQRGNEEYCRAQLGVPGAMLAAVSSFFQRPWLEPIDGLSAILRGYIFNQAGLLLQCQGRLQEAAGPVAATLELFAAAVCDRENAARAAMNLVELLLVSGSLDRAAAVGERAALLADESRDGFVRTCNHAYLAAVAMVQGDLVGARSGFAEAERIQLERQPAYPFLYSVQGALCHSFLLDLGARLTVLEQARQMLPWATKHGSLLDIALGHFVLGHAAYLLASTTPDDSTHLRAEAQGNLDLAVHGLLGSGRQDYLPIALLARAAFLRDTGDRDGATRDLREALDLSERCGFRLHETDARLLAGHLALDPDGLDLDAAQAALARAQTLVTETGYHLRDADLLILEGRLLGKQGHPDDAHARLQKAIEVAEREKEDGCIYQVAVDQANRYLRELDGHPAAPLF